MGFPHLPAQNTPQNNTKRSSLKLGRAQSSESGDVSGKLITVSENKVWGVWRGRWGQQSRWLMPVLPLCIFFYTCEPPSRPPGAGRRGWRTPPRHNCPPRRRRGPAPLRPAASLRRRSLPAAGRAPPPPARQWGGVPRTAARRGRAGTSLPAGGGRPVAAALRVGRAGCSASRGTMGESAGARHGGGGGWLRGGGGGGGRPWCRRRRGWWGRACGRRWPGAGTTTRSRAPSPTAAISICGSSCWRCPWPCTWWEPARGAEGLGRGWGDTTHGTGAGSRRPRPRGSGSKGVSARENTLTFWGWVGGVWVLKYRYVGFCVRIWRLKVKG